LGETFGESATRREVGGKIIYGGGGDGGQPEKQTTVVDIPDWAKPYAKESLGKAAALSDSPYQAYGGERIAQFTPLQQQSFERAGQQQVAGQVGFGTGLAGLAGTSSFSDPNAAASFMSPYMDAVVQRQMESAQRQADIASTQRGAQAVRAGAFGGSRQAIENAEAARALASQKGQIQEQGLQSAFDRAQQQFNQEQSTRLTAAQTLGQLGQQQFGQQMDITGQQQQLGGVQRQATQDILSQQYQDFLNQQRAPYDQLSFMSSIIRGTPMGQTTTMYAPPADRTSQIIGLGTAAAGAYGAYAKGAAAGGEIKGYAAGGLADLNQPEIAAAVKPMPDPQVAEAAQSPNNLVKDTAKAELDGRNRLREQADAMKAKSNIGSITTTLAQMPDQQLQEYAKLNKSDPYIMALVVAEAKRRKEGGMPSQAAPTVVDQQIAGMALPEEMGIAQIPMDMEFADGGIIAFAAGDAVPDPVMVDEERKRNAARVNAGIASAAPLPRRPAGGGIESLIDLDAAEAAKAEQAAAALEKQALADQVLAQQARVEKMKTYGADREGRYKKQEERLEGDKDRNFYESIIDLGLGIASKGSADLMTNLVEGASAGLKGYKTRLDKIVTAKNALDEDLARLYEIREEKVDASGDQLRHLQTQEKTLEASGLRRLNEIGSAARGKKIELKKDALERASRMATAGISSLTPDRQLYSSLVDKFKGDNVAAYNEWAKMTAKGKLPPGVKVGLEANARRRAEILGSPMPSEMKTEQLAALDAEDNRLLGASAAGSASSTGVPLPANASASNLTVGTVYQTARGPAKWTGTGFTPI